MVDYYLLFPVLSNIAYLPTFLYLLNARQYFDAVNILFVFIFSMFYHTCDMTPCIATPIYQTYKFLDYFFAYLMVSLVITYFINIKSEKVKAAFKMIAVGITLLLTILDEADEYNYIIFDSVLLIFALSYFFINILNYLSKFKKCLHMFNHKLCGFIFSNRKYDFHPVRLIFLFIGMILFIIAFIFLSVIKIDYWLFHSLWHIFGAFAIIFIYSLYDNSSLITKCCFIKKRKRFVSVKQLF